jgi:SagB-type dehydrogenase family enzyme
LPRLHPALLVHTTSISGRRRLVAQASAARPPLVLNHPAALSALAALPAEFDREEAGDAWQAAGIPDTAHDQLWAAFSEAGLVLDAPDDDGSWWSELGWSEARTYHEATRDYPFLRMDEPGAFDRDRERMERYARREAGPSPYQRLSGEAVVELPRLASGESPDEWLERMSSEQRRSLEGVGLLLDVCFGERGRVTVAGGGTSLLKSIPSGGARHPTEVFLAAFDLPGIPEGVYHYDVEHHRLDRLRAGQQREAFADATLDLFGRYEDPPVAVLVFTSLVERAMWRYRDPRSFRAVLLDVGHAVMAYRHVARTLGFRTYAYQKMRDREVAELVGLDCVAQPPLYVGTLVPSPAWND